MQPDSKCRKRGSKYFNKRKTISLMSKEGVKRYYRKAKQNCSSNNLREYNKNISYYRQEKKASLPKRKLNSRKAALKQSHLILAI